MIDALNTNKEQIIELAKRLESGEQLLPSPILEFITKHARAQSVFWHTVRETLKPQSPEENPAVGLTRLETLVSEVGLPMPDDESITFLRKKLHKAIAETQSESINSQESKHEE